SRIEKWQPEPRQLTWSISFGGAYALLLPSRLQTIASAMPSASAITSSSTVVQASDSDSAAATVPQCFDSDSNSAAAMAAAKSSRPISTWRAVKQSGGQNRTVLAPQGSKSSPR